MTALLTDNLPLLAGAPNGVKKLRELILELAVRGKLVPQDPSDEPASELLKRIAEEKARLVAEGKIKKQKPLAEVSDDEKPFELPAGWMWTRLGDICLTQTGTTPSKSQSELFGSDVPFIKPGDIYPDQVDYSGEGLSSLGASQSGRVAQAGSLLMVCIGTIGKCNLIERDCSFNQQINSATLYKGLPQYLRIAARSAYFQAKAWSESSSTTIAILNKGKWEAIPLPLPGLNEQHRIVAKVDELMALCDRLEAQQADAESAHAQLVQAMLDSLTQAGDANDFAANWQRLAEHFHTLFTTEPSIDALKQTLLQLAVMGKLVPQDPDDESASELLRRIAEERASYVSGRRSAKQAALPSIDDTEKAFELPVGWEWVRLQQIISVSSGDGLVSANMKADGGVPVYGGNGVTGYHDENNVDNETLVIGRVGYYCGSIHLTPAIAWITDNALIVSFSEKNIYKNFLFWLLKGTNLKEQENATAQPVISGRKIYPIVLAIPPLAEQHRIVAKLDQLMALCDQLKTRLTQARQLNEQLASTLVEQAVA